MSPWRGQGSFRRVCGVSGGGELESGVVAGFVGAVAFGFELEGAVLDVEVLAETFPEPVQHLPGAALFERHHVPPGAREHQRRTGIAQQGAEHPVARRRRAAALHMAEVTSLGRSIKIGPGRPLVAKKKASCTMRGMSSALVTR